MYRLVAERIGIPLSVLLLSWGVYLNGLEGGFHYDDSHSIAENPHIRSLSNLPRFFWDPRTFSREPSMAMYRPFLLVTYAFNYALGGLDPQGYHLVNLLLHGLCALMVYWILAGMGIPVALSWAGGLVFGVHPILSQAVDYVSSRSVLLASLGVLSAFLLTLSAERSWCRRVGAWAAYALALLSKSIAVSLLPLLALREWSRDRGTRRWKEHIPFWLLTLLYIGIIAVNRFLVRSLSQEVRPYSVQILTQIKALTYYVWLAFFPVRLSVEHPLAESDSPWEGAVLGSALFFGSLVFLAWRGRRRSRWGGLGMGWFLAGLGVTLLVPLNVLVSEHRLYLAFAGLLIGLAGYLGEERRPRGGKVLLAAALLVLGGHTWQRNQVWRDELTLWRDAASKAPESFRVLSNLGLALYEAGRPEAARDTLLMALERNPGYGKAWNDLGLVYEAMGRKEEAVSAYQKALSLRPDLAGAFNNLGRLALEEGRVEDAENYLRQALEADSLQVEAWVNLGLLHHRTGALEQAEQDYLEAISIDPECAEAHNNLGLLYQDLGRKEETRQALERAVRLDPEYEEARINLQILRMREEGRSRVEIYERLVAEYPERAELWKGLASACAAEGCLERAVEACQQVLRLEPGDAAARANLERLRDAMRNP